MLCHGSRTFGRFFINLNNFNLKCNQLCIAKIIIIINYNIHREEATSAFIIFNIFISCEYSILVKVEFGVVVKLFVERGKLENLVKNPRSKVRTNNKLNPHVALGQNGTWTILVGGECSHHYTTTPHNRNAQK